MRSLEALAEGHCGSYSNHSESKFEWVSKLFYGRLFYVGLDIKTRTTLHRHDVDHLISYGPLVRTVTSLSGCLVDNSKDP